MLSVIEQIRTSDPGKCQIIRLTTSKLSDADLGSFCVPSNYARYAQARARAHTYARTRVAQYFRFVKHKFLEIVFTFLAFVSEPGTH